MLDVLPCFTVLLEFLDFRLKYPTHCSRKISLIYVSRLFDSWGRFLFHFINDTCVIAEVLLYLFGNYF